MFRLTESGSYFVGIFGANISADSRGFLPFTIRATVDGDENEGGGGDDAYTHEGASALYRGSDGRVVYQGSGQSVVYTGSNAMMNLRGRRWLPMVQTYAPLTVAHGPGVSVALVGVPASFYIRAKVCCVLLPCWCVCVCVCAYRAKMWCCHLIVCIYVFKQYRYTRVCLLLMDLVCLSLS